MLERPPPVVDPRTSTIPVVLAFLLGLGALLLDVGVFCWFVLALAAAYVAAARTRGIRSVAVLLAGPVAQLSGFLLLVLLTAEDVILF